MRNPFPGMNPYWEDPTLWGGVHHLLMSALHQQLNQRLPAGYIALVEEREIYEKPHFTRLSLSAVGTTPAWFPSRSGGNLKEGGKRISEGGKRISHEPVDWAPLTEPFLQIFSVCNKQRLLVAVIELLSPANKTPNSEGRRRYLQKQHDLLRSTAHLLEIDLLHYGEHTVFLPREALLRERAAWDYLIALHRAGESRYAGEVWFVRLSERLPRVRVPLLPEDPEVVIDLQDAVDTVYAQGRYHELLDYTAEPPLSDELRAWVRECLHAQGI
jgi:hypothetical protein